jgi:hypothetical protein
MNLHTTTRPPVKGLVVWTEIATLHALEALGRWGIVAK